MLSALDFDDFSAGVVPAVGANAVGEVFVAAVGAGHQVARFERVVGASAVATTFGDFSFWEWRHNPLLAFFTIGPAQEGRLEHYSRPRRGVKIQRRPLTAGRPLLASTTQD
jgi:hypothetical protein